MATKLEKCACRLNDEFTGKLKAAFASKFGRELKSDFNIFSMALISHPADGKPFTQAQKNWVEAFDSGYTAAMGIVRAAAQENTK